MLRYATGIDSRNWTLFRSCFTDDFHADYGSFGSWTSGDQMTQAIEKMHSGVAATLHRMTNFVATAAPDGAAMRSYVDVILVGSNAGGPAHHAAGYYDDELVKSASGWKLKRRKFTQVDLRIPTVV